jgi:hypothetical protein
MRPANYPENEKPDANHFARCVLWNLALVRSETGILSANILSLKSQLLDSDAQADLLDTNSKVREIAEIHYHNMLDQCKIPEADGFPPKI